MVVFIVGVDYGAVESEVSDEVAAVMIAVAVLTEDCGIVLRLCVETNSPASPSSSCSPSSV